ncbi:MAG TPA: hypothetical protein VF242_07410 [Nitrososphaeraceae archaeon]
MKVILDEAINDIYLKRFNISPDKVIQSIENPVSKKIINLQSYQVIYVLKKFENYYLFIDARNETAGEDEVKIDSAFKIGELLLQNIPIENPLAVLELFANEFGYQLEIGDYRGKFIQNVKIKIPHNYTGIKKKILNNTLITDDDGRLINGTVLSSLVADSKVIDEIEHINIYLFYCISLNKYMYYLKTNNLM